jgi:hypothetical protein
VVLESKFLANGGVDEAFFGEGAKLNEARTAGKNVPATVPVSLQQGAATALFAALNPELKDKSPTVFKECGIMDVLEYARDKEEYEKLWALSEKLVGETFPKV